MKITSISATPLWAPRRKFFGRHMTTAQTAHQPEGMAEGVGCVHALILIKTDNQVRATAASSSSLHATYRGALRLKSLGIRLQTTPGGITGVGEVATCWAPDGVELAAIIDRTLAPLLVGEDPFNIAALAAKMDAAMPGTDSAPAKAALEMALYDIVGKSLQTPVYNLLGGRVRDEIPLSHSIPWGSPEEMATMAAEKKAAGFGTKSDEEFCIEALRQYFDRFPQGRLFLIAGTVKCKVGQGLEQDAAACAAVREAIGASHTLRVDANMGWASVEEAAANINALAKYDLELVEQPLPRHDYAGLAALREETGVPIMVDESLWDPAECAVVVQAGAADVGNVYIAESGGILKASTNLAMCEAAGITCLIGSMPELGVATAAQIHLALSSTNIHHDCDTCGSLYFDSDYLVAPLDFTGGTARPPPGPIGLGVEVDMDIVKLWSVPPKNARTNQQAAPPPSRL